MLPCDRPPPMHCLPATRHLYKLRNTYSHACVAMCVHGSAMQEKKGRTKQQRQPTRRTSTKSRGICLVKAVWVAREIPCLVWEMKIDGAARHKPWVRFLGLYCTHAERGSIAAAAIRSGSVAEDPRPERAEKQARRLWLQPTPRGNPVDPDLLRATCRPGFRMFPFYEWL